MTKDLIDLADLRCQVYVAGAYVLQWYHKYFDQDEASAFVLAGLEEQQRSPERVEGHYSPFGHTFGDFVTYHLPPHNPKFLSGKQDVMHLKEYPEIRCAYLQYLLRDKIKQYMRSKAEQREYRDPFLFARYEDDLVPFLVPTKIREKFFDPVFREDRENFRGELMCDDLGLDYDQFVREHVLLNSTPLDKLWRNVRSRPIHINNFLETVLDLVEKNDFPLPHLL